MVADSMPQLKETLEKTPLSQSARTMVMRFVIAFVMHLGRMSCAAAAGAGACDSCRRVQLSRFAARSRWKEAGVNDTIRRDLPSMEPKGGLYFFPIDATAVSQAGDYVNNAYSTGNTNRREQQGQRYNKNKHKRKRCRRFVVGLLITPSGIRIPYAMPYYTREYCRRHNKQHRTEAECGAALIEQLPIVADEHTQVVVLGDTAYEAKCVQRACNKRNYTWITPANSERVYAGKPGERRQLRESLQQFGSWKLQTIEVTPDQGPYARYRRLWASRSGPKVKPQCYYAKRKITPVHSVGKVQVVFSTKKKGLKHATADDVKILLCNNLSLSTAQIVEMYSLRRQIELFFKELKSTLVATAALSRTVPGRPLSQ